MQLILVLPIMQQNDSCTACNANLIFEGIRAAKSTSDRVSVVRITRNHGLSSCNNQSVIFSLFSGGVRSNKWIPGSCGSAFCCQLPAHPRCRAYHQLGSVGWVHLSQASHVCLNWINFILFARFSDLASPGDIQRRVRHHWKARKPDDGLLHPIQPHERVVSFSNLYYSYNVRLGQYH